MIFFRDIRIFEIKLIEYDILSNFISRVLKYRPLKKNHNAFYALYDLLRPTLQILYNDLYITIYFYTFYFIFLKTCLKYINVTHILKE